MLNISIVSSCSVVEFWLLWTQTGVSSLEFTKQPLEHTESTSVSWNGSCHITDVAWNKTLYVSVQMQKHQLNSCIINVLYIHFLV